MPWRREWQSMPVFLPGKFCGQTTELQSWTRLNDFHFTSSILAWKIPWTELSGRIQTVGLQRARHNWVSEHMSYCSISPRAFLTLFPLAPWVPIPVTCRWCPAVRDLEGLPQKASVYHHLLGISCPLIGPINYLWPPDAKSQLIGKDTDAGKHWRQEEMGMADDEMVGWHHWLSGHVLEQTIGDGEEQGSLAWGCKDLDTTEWPNNNYNLI